jgi:uncharacterized membrane protein YbhN (UPF0104 family)
MFNFSGKKSLPLLILKIGAAALFLWYLRGNQNLTLDHFKWVWSNADPAMLTVSFVITALLLCLNILRWHHFMLGAGFLTSRAQSAASYLAGSLLGLLSPGRIAEFGRGYLYPDYPVKDTALVTFAEKFYFVFFILIFGLAGLLFGAVPLSRFLGHKILPAAAFLLLCTVVLTGFALAKGPRIKFKGLFLFFPSTEPGRFYLLTLTNLVYLLMIFQFYFILIAFFKVKLLHAFLAMSLTLVVLTFFPVSFGNLGVREACFIYLLKELAGFPEIAALNAGFLVFLQNIFLPALLGLAVIIGSSRSRLKWTGL